MKLPTTLLLWICLQALAPAQQTQLDYTVSLGKEGQSFEFSLSVTHPPAKELIFVIPAWAPGAYRTITVQPRSGPLAWKQLKGFRAVDGNGRALPLTLAGDRRYKVLAQGATRVVLAYANTRPGARPNNRSYLTPTAGLIDGPRSFVYLEGHKDLPCHVHFQLPEGWQVGTGLDPTFDPFVFMADDYDRLVDCPTLVGHFQHWNFLVDGVPHRILADNQGQAHVMDASKLIPMFQKIVGVYHRLFGDVPYQHYSFIFTPGSGGGLEHLTSTTISTGGRGLNRRRMGVIAHEFFHTWNVKRLRPKVLGPFDYTRDPRCPDLWFCEGVTNYYTSLGLWRAGLRTTKDFMATFSRVIRIFQKVPAYQKVSPQEASVMMYENWNKMPVSYYTQGQAIGFLLDLMIRGRTHNRHSLDEVMRALYRSHGGYYRHLPPLPGFESGEIPATIKSVTGVDAGPFFQRHVETAHAIAWDRFLQHAGWKLEAVPEQKKKQPPWRIVPMEHPSPAQLAVREGLHRGSSLQE